jgi:glucosamine--fructose-6-phosphate aminotransferase (isomerizing)
MSLMLEEIRQQPAALEHALNTEVQRFRDLQAHFEHHRPRFIVLAARGTSDNAAQFGRYLIEITTAIPVSLAAPSVFTLYGGQLDFREVLFVGISQSGESTDVNLAVEEARRCGATTMGITNVIGSPLAQMADHVILLHAGDESSVAATKTWTSQLLMMYLLAWSLGAPISLDDIARIPNWAQAALDCEQDIAERARAYTFAEKAIVVGRGFNYCNALEFALKLMEACYIVTGSFSSADFLHGPVAITQRGIPAFAFAPPGPTWPGLQAVVEKLRGAQARPLLITDERNRDAAGQGDNVILLPDPMFGGSRLPADVFTPIPYALPAQLLAAHLADIKGLNPDHPRMLSKVTQTL